MSNGQKPSAEALKTFDFDDDGEFGPFTYGGQFVLHSDVLELLARVRREARAEAFEEAKELCLERGRFNRRALVSSGTVRSYESDACADALRALAAKERA